jgi:predicted MFS family arabinose efflux permease
MLADHTSRRLQLGIGAIVLIGADAVLSVADTIWWTLLGAVLWGLQLGISQGLLGAVIADAATDRLRGSAFGIYDVTIGVTAFAASAGAGVVWMMGAPAAAFVVGACIAALAGLLLLLQPFADGDTS